MSREVCSLSYWSQGEKRKVNPHHLILVFRARGRDLGKVKKRKRKKNVKIKLGCMGARGGKKSERMGLGV